MGRNKYIYAFSDFALVISAEVEKGGTWAGAKEELKRPDAKPVFVRAETDIPEGNRALLQLGAVPFPSPPWKEALSLLLKKEPVKEKPRKATQASLFGGPAPRRAEAVVKEESAAYTVPPEDAGTPSLSIYEAVLPVLRNAMADWKTAKDIAEELDVRLGQVNDWLKQAIKDGKVEKKNKPARYRRA